METNSDDIFQKVKHCEAKVKELEAIIEDLATRIIKLEEMYPDGSE